MANQERLRDILIRCFEEIDVGSNDNNFMVTIILHDEKTQADPVQILMKRMLVEKRNIYWFEDVHGKQIEFADLHMTPQTTTTMMSFRMTMKNGQEITANLEQLKNSKMKEMIELALVPIHIQSFIDKWRNGNRGPPQMMSIQGHFVGCEDMGITDDGNEQTVMVGKDGNIAKVTSLVSSPD